jgi:hypothetical protein
VYASVLRDPAFFRFLLRIDEEFAAETRRDGCPKCAARLHVADFPRKPRGCPAAVVEEYSWRFSFTCGQCEKRATLGLGAVFGPPSVCGGDVAAGLAAARPRGTARV